MIKDLENFMAKFFLEKDFREKVKVDHRAAAKDHDIDLTDEEANNLDKWDFEELEKTSPADVDKKFGDKIKGGFC